MIQKPRFGRGPGLWVLVLEGDHSQSEILIQLFSFTLTGRGEPKQKTTTQHLQTQRKCSSYVYLRSNLWGRRREKPALFSPSLAAFRRFGLKKISQFPRSTWCREKMETAVFVGSASWFCVFELMQDWWILCRKMRTNQPVISGFMRQWRTKHNEKMSWDNPPSLPSLSLCSAFILFLMISFHVSAVISCAWVWLCMFCKYIRVCVI